MNTILRDYQLEAVNKVRNHYMQGARAPLTVLPTGSGKTVIFCDIAERVQKKGNRIYILVHRAELLRQTSEHLTKLGVEHGLIAPGHTITGDKVQIASVQTLVRRLDRLPPPDMIIIDEAHHATAGTWKAILNNWPNARLLGCTATPLRLDGKGLGKQAGGFFDCMIEGPTVRNLIDRGFLAQPVVFAPPSGVDMTGVEIRLGDYDKKEVQKRVDKPFITGNAIEHYQRICPGAPTIVFCASVDHAEHVAAQFNASGITASSLTGNMTDQIRKHRIQSLATGGIKVLTSCEIISEGTDIPVVTTAILLRPTYSLGTYLQQCGRALRPAPQIGKTCAYILDHVGNCLRHGLPDDPRVWTLEGSKKKKRGERDATPAANVKQCEGCYAVFSATLRCCPNCGKVVECTVRKIEQKAGQLIQMTKEYITEQQYKRRLEVGQCRTLEDLVNIGKQRNYHPDWAMRIWDARQTKRLKYA